MPPLGGSVKDATDPVVISAARAANPLRILRRAFCASCSYNWQAPVIGACPACHSSEAVSVNDDVEQVCMAQRV